MTAYGQFCPVAKAMELLDERWTLLVVRELLVGSRRFNDLQRGVPRMSPALLSKRLRELQRAGVVERRQEGPRPTYELTEAGRELGPVVDALGAWGARWVPELGEEDRDPHLLLWDVHRNLDHQAMPPGRTVLAFRFPDVAGADGRWWVVADGDGDVDLCSDDPGFPVTVTVTAPLPVLVDLWRGEASWPQALHRGLRTDGPEPARRALPRWLKLSTFAAVPRPRRRAEVPV